MTCLLATNKFIIATKLLHVDFYDHERHKIIQVETTGKEKDYIVDVAISPDYKYLAVLTMASKCVVLYALPSLEIQKKITLPRSASKIRFASNSEHILVADKSGDALLYNVSGDESGSKLLGHLSVLLDILQTHDEKYIITCDRDEKIRVSCYPNTYIINSYCLGHKEFVNHLDILPHNHNYLVSCSGDGTLKFWNYVLGSICHSIDTTADVKNDSLKENFIQQMNTENIEVKTLPIVNFAITQICDNSSLIAVSILGVNEVFIYSINIVNASNEFGHKLEQKLTMDSTPSALSFCNLGLLCLHSTNNTISVYEIHNEVKHLKFCKTITVFENITEAIEEDSDHSFQTVKVLYKRSYDNVLEYQERKRQRIEKSAK